MLRTAIFAGALAGLAVLSPVAAQSWSVGVGVGYDEPDYGPPPGYIYGPPPVLYGAPPPPMVYAPAPPVLYAPAPGVLHTSLTPDRIFDALEDAGYSEFSPMAFRDGVYKLNAVNPRGDLVALEVSALDGGVEREHPLGRHRAKTRVRAPLAAPVVGAPPAAPRPSGSSGSDPLVVY